MKSFFRIGFGLCLLTSWMQVFAASGNTVDLMHLPKLSNYVVDYSGVLSLSDLENLQQTARDYETKTTNQILVVLFPNRNGNELIDIGMSIFKTSQIGQKGKDNGILLLIATDEKKIRIVTGYGMEGSIPDVLAKQWIEQDIRPRVNTGDFAGAIRAFYEKITTTATSDKENISNDGQSLGGFEKFFSLAMLGFIALIFFIQFILPIIIIVGISIKGYALRHLKSAGINLVKTAKFNGENKLLLSSSTTSWERKSVDPANITYRTWDTQHERLEELFPFKTIHLVSIIIGLIIALIVTIVVSSKIKNLSNYYFYGVFALLYWGIAMGLIRSKIASFLSSEKSQKYRDGEAFIYQIKWFYKPIKRSGGSFGSSSGSGSFSSGGGGGSGGGGSSGGGGAGD